MQHPRLILLLCMLWLVLLSGNAKPLYVNDFITVTIPDEYQAGRINKEMWLVESPDGKTFFIISAIWTKDLPLGWADVDSYDENMYHFDSLTLAETKHDHYFDWMKDYRVNIYTHPDKEYRLISDTRIFCQYILNTRFVDMTGERGEVYNTYAKSVKSPQTYRERFMQSLSCGYLVLLILFIGVSVWGAFSRKAGQSFISHLVFALKVAVISTMILAYPLWGEWDILFTYVGALFCLALLSHSTGFYISYGA